MLDEKTGALLAEIDRRCGGEGYKIIEEKDLLGALPKGGDRAELTAMLSFLEAEKYVEISYAEDGVYCVRTLAEGRRYFEQEKLKLRESRLHLRGGFLASGLGALLGALAGSALFWGVSLLL